MTGCLVRPRWVGGCKFFIGSVVLRTTCTPASMYIAYRNKAIQFACPDAPGALARAGPVPHWAMSIVQPSHQLAPKLCTTLHGSLYSIESLRHVTPSVPRSGKAGVPSAAPLMLWHEELHCMMKRPPPLSNPRPIIGPTPCLGLALGPQDMRTTRSHLLDCGPHFRMHDTASRSAAMAVAPVCARRGVRLRRAWMAEEDSCTALHPLAMSMRTRPPPKTLSTCSTIRRIGVRLVPMMLARTGIIRRQDQGARSTNSNENPTATTSDPNPRAILS
jgi:hypothetical protein